MRPVEIFPATQRITQVLVIAPADLIASKVISYHQRRGKPKSWTDRRDLAMLLLTFPDLKREEGEVAEKLKLSGASMDVMNVWKELAAQEIQATDEDDEF